MIKEAWEYAALRTAIERNQISEKAAAAFLKELLPDLRIITSDMALGFDTPTDPGHPLHWRCQPVVSISTMEIPKPIQFENGELRMVNCITFIAESEQYTTADGRRTQDMCRSGPERFTYDDAKKVVTQYGAATSLLHRLLFTAAIG